VDTVTLELRPRQRRRSRNLVDLLLQRERAAHPDSCAAVELVGERSREVSWGQLLGRIRAASEALVSLGVAPGDRVAIFAPMRLDACIADLAVVGARAVTVPVDAAAGMAEVEHVLRDSGARVIFVDGNSAEGRAAGRWSRLRTALARLRGVAQVIAFDLPSDGAARVVSLGDLEAGGRSVLRVAPGGLEQRSIALGPDDLACLCYATGTTGFPKGVMISHGDVTAQARAIPHAAPLGRDDVVLLLPPLAQGLGKIVQTSWIDQGYRLAFGDSPDRFVEEAAEVGATVIPVAPRLLEDLFARVVADAGALPGWAMRELDRYAAARMQGETTDSLRWRLARRLVFGRLRADLQARLGGRMRGFTAGGARLSPRLSVFFEECGLPILDGALRQHAGPLRIDGFDLVRQGMATTRVPVGTRG
jgi:long-chain acyl-CoA synthetase